MAPSSLNRKQFARLLLKRIGIAPSDGAVQALVGWERAEGGHWNNTARFNPLNTTLNLPGSGDTGSQGNISSYRDWQQGIRATKKTLELPAYTGILSALRSGNPGATAAAIGASPWAPDAGYTQLVARTIAAGPKHAGGPGGAPTGGPGGTLHRSVRSRVEQTSPTVTDLSSQSTLLPLLQSLQQRPQQPPSMGLAAPAVSAAPRLAQGAASLLSGAPAATAGVDAAQLVAQAQQDSITTPGATKRTTVKGAAMGQRQGQTPHGGSDPAGKVEVASGANRAGVGLRPLLLRFVSKTAGIYGSPITITTGTNHNRLTVDGNVSDHWDGHAADIAVPIDSKQGDQIATAALVHAGVPLARARQMAKTGGLFNETYHGHRVQVIWKTYLGGDHHNHVHIGINN